MVRTRRDAAAPSAVEERSTGDNASTQAAASGDAAPAAAATAATAAGGDHLPDLDGWKAMPTWKYRLRQYTGIVLCVFALFGCVLGTGTGSEWWSRWAMIGYLLMIVAALGLHETRPYQGPGWTEISAASEAQAKIDARERLAKEE